MIYKLYIYTYICIYTCAHSHIYGKKPRTSNIKMVSFAGSDILDSTPLFFQNVYSASFSPA